MLIKFINTIFGPIFFIILLADYLLEHGEMFEQTRLKVIIINRLLANN